MHLHSQKGPIFIYNNMHNISKTKNKNVSVFIM